MPDAQQLDQLLKPGCLYCYWKPSDLAQHFAEEHHLSEKEIQEALKLYAEARKKPRTKS
jgi:hypothetical protein